VLARVRELAPVRHSAEEPRPGLVPGTCKGKAHRPEHCGYAGRRILVSRKWSGKSLADHRADRKAWLVQTLGLETPDPARYTWSQVTPGDPDYLPPEQRLLHIIADRARWKTALAEARRKAGSPSAELSATDRRAA
jgi:replication initiator protein RepSA